jgi:hypothetical protein
MHAPASITSKREPNCGAGGDEQYINNLGTQNTLQIL